MPAPTSAPTDLLPLSPDAIHDELEAARQLLRAQSQVLGTNAALRAALLLPLDVVEADLRRSDELLTKHLERLNAGLPAIDGVRDEASEAALGALMIELAGESKLVASKTENLARLLNGEVVPTALAETDLSNATTSALRRVIVVLFMAATKLDSLGRLLSGDDP